MSMSSDPEVTQTTLTLHFGATLAVTTNASGYEDWIKPAASYSMTWKGIATEDQIKTATNFIQSAVLSPILEDIIVTAKDRLTEARRHG
jgi:hypothetical protein